MIVGVDEVGRGPLAGPVVAAAVILPDHFPKEQLMDSKKLTAKRREVLAELIHQEAVAVCIAEATPVEIDTFNILQASLLAMKRAVEGLAVLPTQALVDGKFCPKLSIPAEAVVKGDQKVPEISAASIVAKVYRDRHMVELDALYPGYGLAQHAGYPTKQHMKALVALGASEIHRKSFAPVRRVLTRIFHEVL